MSAINLIIELNMSTFVITFKLNVWCSFDGNSKCVTQFPLLLSLRQHYLLV